MIDVARGLLPTRRVVLGLAGLWALLLLLVFSWRVGFPLELEWMEGGMLHQAHRIQQGAPAYPPPSPRFVPFLYTPLYSIVLAGLGWVFPLGFALGRVVSILAWIATMIAVWRAVLQEGKPRAHAAVAVGLACSGYVFAFRWLDLARPDTLFIALVVWGLVLLRGSGHDARRALWAGVLVALAFWTKQTAASFVIASGVGALWVAPRKLWVYAGTIALIDGGGVLVGNAITDGWLWTYIYQLHQAHAFNDERFTTKTWGMFVHAWPFVMLVVLGLVSAGMGRLPRRIRAAKAWLRAGGWRRRATAGPADPAGDPAEAPDAEAEPAADASAAAARAAAASRASAAGLAYWTLMAIAGLLVSAIGYATQWAEPNAFIPGVVLGALALAVALPVGGIGEVAALALVAVQLVFGALVEPRYHPVQTQGWAGLRHSYTWQDPWRTLPTAHAWRQAAALRETLETADGEVFALHRPWWSVLAGGDGHVGSMGLTDVSAEARAAMQTSIRTDVEAQRYAQIWIEGEPPRWLARSLRRHYRVERRRHGAARVRPLSGYMSEAGMVTPYRNDQLMLVPIGDRMPPAGTTIVADFEGGTLGSLEPEGRAFGRPSRGTPSRLPMAGPYGGQYLLSSGGAGGRMQLQGFVRTPVLTLPSSGRLELLVGMAGRGPRGLSVAIVEEGGAGRREALPVPRVPHALDRLRWEITPEWAGARIRVRLGDEAPEALLYVDDVWLVSDATGS